MLNVGGVRIKFQEGFSIWSIPIVAKEQSLNTHLSFTMSEVVWNTTMYLNICYERVTWMMIGSRYYVPHVHG